jgi:peptide/nickel transport system ATP-binding protein
MTALLDMQGVSVFFRGAVGEVQATRSISLTIAPGEMVGLVGESGCGKSVTGLAIMGLLPAATSRVVGRILLDGEDLLAAPPARLRRLRGRRLSMIFQEPMSALDPVFTIGEQISETVLAHHRVSRREAYDRTIEALRRVGIPEPQLRYDAYPHELSGGMRQRAMIAIALVCEPALLIADEPTTALDVTVQAQIVDVLGELCAELGMALLFVTHDLGLVSQTCSRLVTMYAGEVVEDRRTDDVLVRPGHPYSSGLLRSLPAFTRRKANLPAIPGRVPAPDETGLGCRFEPRCAHARPPCLAPQALLPVPQGAVRCCRYAQLALPGVLAEAAA